jgi:hypothetical protein
MTLPEALRRALAILRKEKRGVLLTTSQCRYRLAPSGEHPRGYLISLSIRYNSEWQPWGTVANFDVDDIITDKWSVH